MTPAPPPLRSLAERQASVVAAARRASGALVLSGERLPGLRAVVVRGRSPGRLHGVSRWYVYLGDSTLADGWSATDADACQQAAAVIVSVEAGHRCQACGRNSVGRCPCSSKP